nr:leukotriene A-4 hydrolase-like isoform X2 [Chrysemys picta bellii]
MDLRESGHGKVIASTNVESVFKVTLERWLRLCIQAKWEEAIPLALKMATEQGRLKFTCPLFRDLYNFEKSRDQAVSSFMQHRVCMHPVAAMLVAKDLKVDQGQTA